MKQIFDIEATLLAAGAVPDFPEFVSEVLLKQGSFAFKGFETIQECLHLQRTVQQYYGPKDFGKFNLTLVNNPSFFIIVMFMDELGTEIHDHPFWGCFTPLIGSPCEVKFEFQKDKTISDRVDTGVLRPISSHQIKIYQPMKITKESIHLIVRPKGGQFSLVIGQVLPQPFRENHFFFYPGLRIRNRHSSSYSQRLLTLVESTSINDMEFEKLLGNFEIDEVLRLFLMARYGKNIPAAKLIEHFIKKHHAELWPYMDSYDAYMAKLFAKIKI